MHRIESTASGVAFCCRDPSTTEIGSIYRLPTITFPQTEVIPALGCLGGSLNKLHQKPHANGRWVAGGTSGPRADQDRHEGRHHGRYITFQSAEVAVPRKMFAEILSLIAGLRAPPAQVWLKLRADATNDGSRGVPRGCQSSTFERLHAANWRF